MPFEAAGHTFGSWDDEVGDVADLLDLLDHRPDWHRRAACRGGVGGVDFFAGGAAAVERARAVCTGCVVVEECGAWALEQGPELHGTWGGMTRDDRSAINGPRRAERRPAA